VFVPANLRQIKGSYFTPSIWVKKSQEYLAKAFGDNWQEEYYVWDCAAGTGNLLAGLTDKYHIWASTLDRQDVDVMHDRINNGVNLLHEHVFRFDFLNDDISQAPESLRKVIDNPQQRKRLLFYINPPYKRGRGVANTKWHKDEMGEARDELFAQFLYRIYKEFPEAIIADFSTLKILQAPNFKTFRQLFQAKLEKMFVVPANTFDNVEGAFPIGFFVWQTSKKEMFKRIKTDVYDEAGNYQGKKTVISNDGKKLINDWLNSFADNHRANDVIGFLNTKSNDFQHYQRVVIGMENILSRGDVHKSITLNNLVQTSVYFAVRKCIKYTWLINRDQFFHPNRKWEKDVEFQNDCLAYTLFTNKVSAKYGVNHWLPFREEEINARTAYDSHLLISFMSGKKVRNAYTDLFEQFEEGKSQKTWQEGVKREFSTEAAAVFDAGRELWRYYHLTATTYNVNASLYDIREYFKGRDEAGKMSASSADETFNRLDATLRAALQTLASQIAPKVYDYGFLI